MSTRAAGPPIIEVRDLARSFGDVRAVDGISFEVGRGEVYGLVGPDGAGKTTALRMIAGVLAPDAGQVRVDGLDVARDPEAARALISYMPQRFGLYEDLTVDENIRFYADLFGVGARERHERAARLLGAAGLVGMGRRLAGKLSGGMKQKLGLVCALVHTPRVLLLDEPTNGVDPVSRRDFWAILYDLIAEGVSILISTAWLDEAERCQRVGLIDRGRLLYSEPPETMRERLAGQVVSVGSPDPRRARDVLRAAPGVRSLILVGDHVRLTVDDAARRLPELGARLAAAGVPVDELAPTPASIEDLFVASVAVAPSGERDRRDEDAR